MKRLVDYDWPGNVRELRNMVERALILRKNGRLNFNFKFGTAFPGSASSDTPMNHVMPFKQAEAIYIQKVLDVTNGRIQGSGGAAELLDIHPNTLRSKMNKLGIVYKKQYRGV
jgi:DNA-binding NtrC family response regulator